MTARAKKLRAVLSAWLALGVALGAQVAPLAAQSAPAAASTAVPAQRLKLDGVPNAGQVSATLYRGGQPERKGYEALKKLGIEIVVNFRDEKDKIEAERQIVESLGMHYVSVPWSSSRDPKPSEVAAFLQLLRDHPKQKVFAHCRRGAERTGVMIAAYRMAFEKWTPEQAIREMDDFHFSGFWLPHLKKYVRNFPQELAKDPQLRALLPATAGH
jgi:tyrosine-protein phosphatase SIW14